MLTAYLDLLCLMYLTVGTVAEEKVAHLWRIHPGAGSAQLSSVQLYYCSQTTLQDLLRHNLALDLALDLPGSKQCFVLAQGQRAFGFSSTSLPHRPLLAPLSADLYPHSPAPHPRRRSLPHDNYLQSSWRWCLRWPQVAAPTLSRGCSPHRVSIFHPSPPRATLAPSTLETP